MNKGKSKAIIFPKVARYLQTLGENIRLARKRRRWSTANLSERAGIARGTLVAIEKGAASVSIGHYASVLFALGLAEDLSQVASADPEGRRQQDIETLSRSSRGRA